MSEPPSWGVPGANGMPGGKPRRGCLGVVGIVLIVLVVLGGA